MKKVITGQPLAVEASVNKLSLNEIALAGAREMLRLALESELKEHLEE